MTKTIKIKVPYFVDDPWFAPCPTISPFPFGSFTFGIITDYIIIEDGKLFFKASKLSIFSNKSFNLSDMEKLVVQSKTLTCWGKDFSLGADERIGTDLKLDLLDNQGRRKELIPKFFMQSHGSGKEVWEKFLNKLSISLNLPIIEEKLS